MLNEGNNGRGDIPPIIDFYPPKRIPRGILVQLRDDRDAEPGWYFLLRMTPMMAVLRRAGEGEDGRLVGCGELVLVPRRQVAEAVRRRE